MEAEEFIMGTKYGVLSCDVFLPATYWRHRLASFLSLGISAVSTVPVIVFCNWPLLVLSRRMLRKWLYAAITPLVPTSAALLL